MLLRLCIFLGLICTSAPAAGLDEDSIRLRLKAYQAPELTPQESYAGLKELVRQVNPGEMPALWSDLVIGLVNLEIDSNVGQEWMPRLDEVLLLTEKLDLKRQRLLALLVRAQIDTNVRPHEEIKELFRQATDLCSTIQDPMLCNRSWWEMAHYYYIMHDYPIAVLSMQKALHFLDAKNPNHEPQFIESKNELAIILSAVGDFDKARPLFEDAIAYAHRVGDAYQEMVFQYNLAACLADHLDRYPMELVKDHFEKSLSLARELDKPDLIGWVLGGFGEFHAKNGEPAKALLMLDEAARLMPKDLWVRETAQVEKTRARALVRMKRYAESQEALAKALALTPLEAVDARNELLGIDYEIALGQNRSPDALRLLQQYHGSTIAIMRDQRNRQLQSLQASLGLQIEEQRSAELQEKNRQQAGELERLDRIRRLLAIIALLGLLSGASLLALKWKDREVKRQKRNLQHILDSIEESILPIRLDGTVAEHSSKHSAVLFPRDEPLTGTHVAELLFEPSDARSQLQNVLQCILGEPTIAWDLNSGLLPLDLFRSGSQLSLHWHPINRHDKVTGLILTVRDITDVARYREQLKQEQHRTASLVEGLMEIMSRNPHEAIAFIRDLPDRIQRWQGLSDQRRLRAEFHTLKGNSRMLGLASCAEQLHALEDAVHDPQQLSRKLAEFHALAVERGRIFADLGYFNKAHLWQLCGDIFVDLRQRLQAEELTIKELRCSDQIDDWTAIPLDQVRSILTHACNNAVDHGYLLPRKKAKATEPLELIIESSSQRGTFFLRVIDGGVGLDWEQIQKIAGEKGFKPAPGRPISDVLFLPQVSTADQVSLTSGRGIGLDAIASLCQELGGQCSLVDRQGSRGTELLVEWPLSAALLSKSS